MKRSLLLLLAVVVCLGVVGCYSTPVMPPQGWLFSDVKAPLSANNQGIKVAGSKVGIGESQCVLGLVTTGDSSIEEAADDGDITNIAYADYEYFNILGIYQRFRVKVHGE